MKTPFAFTIADLGLENVGPLGYLLGEIAIAGTLFPVEAIEVKPGMDYPTATNDVHQTKIDHLVALDQADDFQTLRIEGRPHILLIIPYQR